MWRRCDALPPNGERMHFRTRTWPRADDAVVRPAHLLPHAVREMRPTRFRAIIACLALSACQPGGAARVERPTVAPSAPLESRVPTTVGVFKRVEHSVLPHAAG